MKTSIRNSRNHRQNSRTIWLLSSLLTILGFANIEAAQPGCDPRRVFFSANGTGYSHGLDDHTSVDLGPAPSSAATDGRQFFKAELGGLYKREFDQSWWRTIVDSRGYGFSDGVALQNDKVSLGILDNKEIFSCDFAGGQSTIYEASPASVWPVHIEANSSSVFYGDGNYIYRRNDLGADTQVLGLVPGTSSFFHCFTVSENRIYWVTPSQTRIRYSNTDGTNSAILIDGRSGISSLEIGSSGMIYWTEASTVFRAQSNGSGAETVFTHSSPVSLLAVHDQNPPCTPLPQPSGTWKVMDICGTFSGSLGGSPFENQSAVLRFVFQPGTGGTDIGGAFYYDSAYQILFAFGNLEDFDGNGIFIKAPGSIGNYLADFPTDVPFTINQSSLLVNGPEGFDPIIDQGVVEADMKFSSFITPTAEGELVLDIPSSQLISIQFHSHAIPIVYALSNHIDSDGDSLSDATEARFSSLGFDWLKAQPEIGKTLADSGLLQKESLPQSGYYSEAALRQLHPGTPLLFPHSTSGIFSLLLDWKVSTDLRIFNDFNPANSAVSITPKGDIEWTFEGPSPKAFFQLTLPN